MKLTFHTKLMFVFLLLEPPYSVEESSNSGIFFSLTPRETISTVRLLMNVLVIRKLHAKRAEQAVVATTQSGNDNCSQKYMKLLLSKMMVL